MVLEKVKEIIAEQLCIEVDDIASGADLKTTLDADSLDIVEIVIELEDAFDIEISDEDAAKFVTVEDMASYIESIL